jgi:hypothetical protein
VKEGPVGSPTTEQVVGSGTESPVVVAITNEAMRRGVWNGNGRRQRCGTGSQPYMRGTESEKGGDDKVGEDRNWRGPPCAETAGTKSMNRGL